MDRWAGWEVRVTVDGRRFTLTEVEANLWSLATSEGAALGNLRRFVRYETRTTMQYRNGRPHSGAIRKVEATYWSARLPGRDRGRIHESRAAAIRWLLAPPAWWLAEQAADGPVSSAPEVPRAR